MLRLIAPLASAVATASDSGGGALSCRMLNAVATVVIDNERVRVTHWRFAPGSHTGRHRHEYAYVVVPMTTGPLALLSDGGESSESHELANPTTRPLTARPEWSTT